MKILYLYVRFKDADGKPFPYRGFEEWSLNFSKEWSFEYIEGKIVGKQLNRLFRMTFGVIMVIIEFTTSVHSLAIMVQEKHQFYII